KSWGNVLHGPGKEHLEQEVLPIYLPRCRWFGGKMRAIMAIDILDRVLPPEGRGECGILFLRVEYHEGTAETYVLPMAWAEGAEAEEIRTKAPGAVIAEAMGPDRSAILYDAVHSPGFRASFLRLVAGGTTWAGLSGALRGRSRLDAIKDPVAADEPSHVLKAEQSNTSIIYPGRFFLKLMRRLDEGESPELEILRFLDESTPFRQVPPYIGAVEYAGGAGATYSIAVVTGLVPHEQEAWSYTLELAGRYVEWLAAKRHELGPAPARRAFLDTPIAGDLPDARDPVEASDGIALEFARLLGRRTAEMHLALASRGDNPAFAPEPYSRLYQRGLYQSMRNQMGRVYEQLAKSVHRLPADRQDLARRVLDARPKVMGTFGQLLERLIPTVKIRIHGDYHLGQVLYTGKDVVILDFEGEPARALSERKLKRSPWRDVAGMIRSFHYAIHSVWPQATGIRAEERKSLEPYIELWPDRMAGSFLDAYLRASQGASFLPAQKDWELLLKVFLMEKAVYELGYEINNRPDWVHIPMLGILSLLPRG
ncbi:MAG TPA: putative maltokinase, partial [Fibrobacteria bacterium]|nr:putative maltokinase [Fibrobacteria bacterium]